MKKRYNHRERYEMKRSYRGHRNDLAKAFWVTEKLAFFSDKVASVDYSVLSVVTIVFELLGASADYD